MTEITQNIHRRRAAQFVREGFSLIELMIAITIMGILAAIIVPNFMSYLQKARISNTKATIRTFEQAITMYQADMAQYPTALRDLIKQPADEKAAKKWQGPYLKKKDVPQDPWGNKYQYRPTPEAENPYELYSYGPKGKGAPKQEWISVWDEN
ncbi:MAG: type II secretion system major pseudopilin GspG [bacterium]|nr:type II secretion system major pseudopilin GspG [bacterium]